MSLLENLQTKLSLEYLSDLRFLEDLSGVKEIIKSVPIASHPLSEWNDALKYLTKSEAEFTSAEETKEYLLNFNK